VIPPRKSHRPGHGMAEIAAELRACTAEAPEASRPASPEQLQARAATSRLQKHVPGHAARNEVSPSRRGP
jgi:hypothetical protein